MSLLLPFRRMSFLLLLGIALCVRAGGQCSDWSAQASVSASSLCAASGGFNVSLHGGDVANLSNIRYGVPLTATGFSVPLNSSPAFTGIPAGTFQVSVVASCNGTFVGRNTTVTIPGSYTAPVLVAGLGRASFSCGATGRLNASVSGGSAPFTFRLTSTPTGYAGPTTIVSATNGAVFDNLPAGNYAVQVSDACMNGTIPRSVTIPSINEAALPLKYTDPVSAGCDTLVVDFPRIDDYNTGFEGYRYDTAIKATMSISGGIAGTSVRFSLAQGRVAIRLPAGMSLKDVYGKMITYTVYLPCGAPVVRTYTIGPGDFTIDPYQHCNRDVDVWMSDLGKMCFPLQYVARNLLTNQLYGPVTVNGGAAVLRGLPLGSYAITVTTADGYTKTNTHNFPPVVGNPYSVRVLPGTNGLQGYAEGFRFSTSGPANSSRSIELFSGSVGYSAVETWYGNLDFVVRENSTPGPATVKFPAGTYVWKITDDCGTYYLTVQVTAADLCSFVIDSVEQIHTCQGVLIRPWIRGAQNGVSVQTATYNLLFNGRQMYSSSSIWPFYNSGTQILLTRPGRYTIMASTQGNYPPLLGRYYPYGGFTLGYPNMYQVTQDIIVPDLSVSVDINATQGFLCKGAAAGSAQLYVKGSGGMPFRRAGGYYQYSLAASGNGLAGPYIATNITGIFTGFGGNVGGSYDVKVTDSCGGFAVQQVRILDLGTVPLISSSGYVGCAGGRVQLSALFLPNATYSWTGPNGFTSTQRNPVIDPLTNSSIGVYRVAIHSSECNAPLTDTTILTLNPPPPKPVITFSCDPRPPLVTVVNPSPGISYKWQVGYLVVSGSGPRYVYAPLESGGTPFSTRMFVQGSLAAVAIDTLTGCQTHSDSLRFDAEPYDTLRATILTTRLRICTGDTTTLIAGGFTSQTPAFQWLRNGIPIPGETKRALITSQPGDYRVFIDEGTCSKDTSPAVNIRIVSPPRAQLSASDTVICSGDTARLFTAGGPDYEFSWPMNGSSIPGAFDSSTGATQTGTYQVLVSNGGCIAQSRPVFIRVNPAPALNLSPNTDQQICPGQRVIFNAGGGPGVGYSWTRNGTVIPGASSDTLIVRQAGVYGVIANMPSCPAARSPLVQVRLLAASLTLPPDTTICSDGPFRIQLQIDTGFTSIAWNSGATDRGIDVTVPGLYWVTAGNRCGTFADSFRVRHIEEFRPRWPLDTTICNAAGVSLLRVPAILSDIRWNTGAQTSSIITRKPGRYWVEGISPCGMIRDTIDIRFCIPKILHLGISADTLCVGDCIRPIASVDNYPVNFYWSLRGAKPDTGWSPHPGTFCFDSPGIYSLRLRVDNPGGQDSLGQDVIVAEKPKPRFRDTTITAPYRAKVILPACADAAHADWYRNDTLICRDCPGLSLDAIYYYNTYKCVLRNASCPDSCSYAMRVVDIPHQIWLPDAFTPNGDGRNDRFGIITDNPNVQAINFEVFNRWGQRVYTGNLNNAGWDGSFGGKPAEMGTYFWQLRYRVLDKPDVTHYIKGDILLVR